MLSVHRLSAGPIGASLYIQSGPKATAYSL